MPGAINDTYMTRSSRESHLDRSPNLRMTIRGSFVGFLGLLVLFGILTAFWHTHNGFAGGAAAGTVSLLALPCYFVAGYFTVDSKLAPPMRNGAIAGAISASCGVALSLLIWLADRNGPFLTGKSASHPAVALVGPLVFGCCFGALGGATSARRRRSGQVVSTTTSPTGSASADRHC
jgi:hypothetical protein